MQAIVTKYLGPTNHHGARVKATCQAMYKVVSWDDALDVDENHRVACRMLCQELGWRYTDALWVGGGMPDGRGNVYVNCMATDGPSPADVLIDTIMAASACCMDNGDDVTTFTETFGAAYTR